MCLVKVRQEEEHIVPYRVVDRHNSRRRASHTSQRRYSRTEVVHHESPRPSASYIVVPTPKPLAIPAPQPVPVFVQPLPAPMPMPMPPPAPSHVSHHNHSHSQHGGAHYVEVSPRSSMTSRTSSPNRSEYVYHEREYRRERQHSPEPRYDHYRYVEPASSESDHYERYRERSRQRSRSRSRGGYDDARGNFRDERVRVTIEDEGRRRDYRR
ncbi:hypothetical protein GQ44DRAFT_698789 [Phaeosphaeriaceae sp. PMI808]|nr:hypothetical protein GQ44DRAFT_698789 [Phaeosphaeriaceae sp. PMI808]